ncbi:unnamed protein product [Citrullus colocynthis]|uniref:Uncharacterized protein n=1 Tax=Citrullus colocynthis TaxID=252529 RepID=A0ABP0YKG7_9ROSI
MGWSNSINCFSLGSVSCIVVVFERRVKGYGYHWRIKCLYDYMTKLKRGDEKNKLPTATISGNKYTDASLQPHSGETMFPGIPMGNPLPKPSTTVDPNRQTHNAFAWESEAALKTIICFLVMAMAVCFLLLLEWTSTTILSLELICKTTDAEKLQQSLTFIDASSSYKSRDTARYLIQLPTQYFSARSSVTIQNYFSWTTAYDSQNLQAAQDFIKMNMKSTANKDNEQYIMVRLLLAVVDGRRRNFPNVKTFEDVIGVLHIIKSINRFYQCYLLAEDLFWTHPFNNVTDLPSLNLIVHPQPQQLTPTVATY